MSAEATGHRGATGSEASTRFLGPPAAAEREGSEASGAGPGGRRLAAAFDVAAELPALAESRARLLELTAQASSSTSQIAAVVESDPALAIAVMRAAGSNRGRPRGGVGSVPEAVAALAPAGVEAAVGPLGTYEFFDSQGSLPDHPQQFRRHALATRHAVDRVAEEITIRTQDALVAAALLHDVGKLVLGRLYADYGDRVDERSRSPEDRVELERRELGLDHALIGGVLVRRWGVAAPIATAIERHHRSAENDVAGNGRSDLGATVRLADLIAHHHHGNAVAAPEIERVAARCRVAEPKLRRLLHEFPYRITPRRSAAEPSPLTARETSALRGLADGMVYKQIAAELGVSASTVRTHLHNAYRKLGVADRAQAVLLAHDRGWI